MEETLVERERERARVGGAQQQQQAAAAAASSQQPAATYSKQ